MSLISISKLSITFFLNSLRLLSLRSFKPAELAMFDKFLLSPDSISFLSSPLGKLFALASKLQRTLEPVPAATRSLNNCPVVSSPGIKKSPSADAPSRKREQLVSNCSVMAAASSL
jgi:hypothetical protein